jgi:hypothetical protein
VAGCWAGGLGLRPTAIGAGAWIVAYLLCMVGAWSTTMKRSHAGNPPADSTQNPFPLLGTPLVSALGLAMAVSLVAAG